MANDGFDDCRIEPETAHALLCEYFDPATPATRADEIEQIIQSCPQSFAWLESEREIRQIVRRCNCHDQAPDALRQRIVQSLSVSYTEITEITEITGITRFRHE